MMFRLSGIALMFAMLFMVLLGGCSSSGKMVMPGQEPTLRETEEGISSHSPWGLWQFIADPEVGTLEYVEFRNALLHLNALRFLEPPPYLYLTLESPPQFSGNILTVDIGLRHPFLGLNQFTGFDVCGILITDATSHPYDNPALLIGGDGDTRLLNADGYARWWNPTEFPYNSEHPIFGYIDGELGTPDDLADYSGILSGYKYYCDELADVNSPLGSIDPESRGVFSAGQKNVRQYEINMEGGLVFNYAIDANWMMPAGDPPYDIPGDFSEGANRPEAWNISVDVIENTLFYEPSTGTGGGSAEISIDVYDWFNAEQNTVAIYSFEDEFTTGYISTPSGGGTGYSTYEIEFDAQPISTDPMPILIEVESESMGYGDLLPDENVSAYFMYELDVEEGTAEVLPDICTNWGDETGCYMHWQNNQYIHWIFTQFNFASDSQGNVWMWCHRTGNALSRCLTPFNGDWGTMYEEYLTGGIDFWVFHGSTIDISLTPTFDGGLIAGCSPTACNDPEHPEWKNPLSIAWWDGTEWHDKDANQWKIYDVESSDQIANRINGYRDSTERFHAYCQIDGEMVDFHGDTWKGDWTEDSLFSNMPVGQADYQCQTRADFVSESSDGYIWLCWVNGTGFQVARRDPDLGTWTTQLLVADDKYDSPTIYIDNQDRVFVAVRYYVSDGEDQVRLFIAEDGSHFDLNPLTIVSEPEARIDPCYLTLKGDAVDHLFLTFPYRPGDEGAYAAIIASKSGGLEWTDVCVLSDPIIKHPGMAIRPDGSIEVGYGIPKNGDPNSGSTDTAFSEMNYLYGRSHPGFVE